MPGMPTKRLAAAAIAALALTLAGCTVTSGQANFAGVPEKEDISSQSRVTQSGMQAFWLSHGTQLGVTVSGSSTCPPIGNRIEVLKPAGEGNTVEVILEPIGDGICTMDLVPHTTTFWTPSKVSTTEPLIVIVNGEEILLPKK